MRPRFGGPVEIILDVVSRDADRLAVKQNRKGENGGKRPNAPGKIESQIHRKNFSGFIPGNQPLNHCRIFASAQARETLLPHRAGEREDVPRSRERERMAGGQVRVVG